LLRASAGHWIAFAERLGKKTEVVVEATGNAMAVVKLTPHVKRVLIANPQGEDYAFGRLHSTRPS
jgi:hypothetical protein